jgi:hypothetical protein
MKIFLDTSALFKLYHEESETMTLQNSLGENDITSFYLSQITKIEFASTVWKKVRIKEINETEATQLIKCFESDYTKFSFINIDLIIVQKALVLLSKYGSLGLRTLDSLQLSTAVVLKDKADLFITFDSLLNSFFKSENLPNEFPDKLSLSDLEDLT